MSTEDALFYKILLESGCPEELDEALGRALEEENPLSDVVLDLAYSGEDQNSRLSALNKYLESVPPERIDTDAVVDRIFEFYIEKYNKIDKNEGYIKNVNGFMAMIFGTYLSTAELKCLEDNSLLNYFKTLSDYYELTEEGIIEENAFRECLEALLYKKERSSLWRPVAQKKSLLDLIKSLFSKQVKK